MSGIVTRIDITEELGIAELSERGKKRVGKAAFDALGKWYIANILRRRFRPEDQQRLGYTRRDKKYNKKKQIGGNRGWRWGKGGGTVKGRGQIDNLLTGGFRSAVMKTAAAKAYPSRTTITVDAPNYIQNKPRNLNRKWSWGEINRRTDDENAKMADVLETAVEAAFLAEPKRRKRTTL